MTDSMEESKLIFSLDCHEEGPVVAFSRDKPRASGGTLSRSDLSLGMDLGSDSSGQRQWTQGFHIPHSPSSPGSLADLSTSSEDLPMSSHLVKSSSTELETRVSHSARAKPLLSLVKSLSTEISYRGEPEVNLSKSDSKLHMHPWKQLTQHRIPEAQPRAGGAGEGDIWGAGSSSAGSTSPTESRGSSLIAELEDTRRKFSEAMQDPMSMFSKMMGDECSSSGSPKQGRASGAGDPPASHGAGGGSPINSEDAAADAQLRFRRRTTDEQRGVCASPQRRPSKGPRKRSHSPEPHDDNRDSHYEVCKYRDMPQVVELQERSRGAHRGESTQPRCTVPGASMPRCWLFVVGLLTFGVFVLPLPSYITGLSVGVACGFLLGLVVVYLFTPRRPAERRNRLHPSQEPGSAELGETQLLEGWMNEIQGYDPETFQPSLTSSVYATLEGSRLRLAYPRASIPRRAAFDETPPEVVFVRSRTYQLADCKVSLLPSVLARKRVWNRKYPICLVLAEGVQVEEEEILLPGSEDEERATERPDLGEPHSHDTLYLFGRTGREKEDWFQHFLSASRASRLDRSPSREQSKAENVVGGDTLEEGTDELPGAPKAKVPLDYTMYMSHLIGLDSVSPAPSPCPSDHGSPTTSKMLSAEECFCEGAAKVEAGAESNPGGSFAEVHPAWVNSLVGRIFWDFLREKYWSDKVAHKIQKKLSKIRLPYFMNELTLADLDMGTCLPEVLSTSKPSLDQRGLWLELDVAYMGGLQMTLETKMNLCKLGKEGWAEADRIPETCQEGSKPRVCVLADSDEESSSAGSSDEEDLPPAEPQGSPGDKGAATVGADGHAGGSTGRKILRFVDKIAKSKYFQKATENEYIKKKIAEVSNMPLMLSVEVLELSGTLAINIPPPPTDRIWYSFRGPPRLDLHVRPMLGEREVTLTHVTEWIERKLQCEFQKVFVMPNMDDLYLPLMTPGVDNPPPCQPSPAQLSSSRQSSVDSQEYMSE
ncbi:testis-expressed protein 2-like [Gadus chalcogrammus]|uniref:testis-expressed protein 2-like n=1 Tax=Gadus chalcogrammus TaxID=1042646 RepID=UPI0024C3D0A9|nr:testis-expressed protein 2-like [Gadus chalcogrammus]XP_056436964.1 testis-expressed protein 2-like [Gadus chalcogrammus]XP_056436974.1 testis-expressed protein 2-like [Gadus chalcogrammus]